jgi:hypothetical protein
MIRFMPFSLHSLAGLILGAGLLWGSAGNATESSQVGLDFGQYAREKLSIGIAAGYERFDTTLEFTDKTSGRPPIFVDAEGTLGLDETQLIPIIYGYWRIAPKHGLGFSYFGIRREGAKLAVNQNFGDLNVTGEISVSDRSSFYQLSYDYAMFEDDRALVLFSLGLYVVDLKTGLIAEGEISVGDVPVASGRYVEEFNQVTPFPVIGATTRFKLTPRWTIGAKVALVGGEVSGVRAGIFTSHLNASYAFNKNLSLLFGVNYFSADITVDKTRKKTEIGYGFEGAYLGLDVGF